MDVLYPLGTVVTLKEQPEEYVIIGYCPVDAEGKVFTYLGIDAVLGLTYGNLARPFMKDEIEKIVFRGYSDEESEEFRICLGMKLAAARTE